MGALISIFNYFWFRTFGYEEHVRACDQLALDNARRAIAKAERRVNSLALIARPGYYGMKNA